ncbi:hypothetical protein SAMN02745194_03565 [Roseomonas rosea]|uniref:Uncharacterized protein n=1 Tax=Muricoccus roseus TaxID=198092 RepID=A0A1M6MSL1_9PROT|nr:hypothetical protein [Roseomonas rosea]SHJ86379.1 hypothetical protein SAMN02745194_03565 [Roseomonas rosea]
MIKPRAILGMIVLAGGLSLVSACSQGVPAGSRGPSVGAGTGQPAQGSGPIIRGNPGTGAGQQIVPGDNRGPAF